MRFLRRFSLVGSILLFAMISSLSCANDSNPTKPPSGVAADVTISIAARNGSSSYSPNPNTVTVGQTVSWKNNHSLTHTATSDNGTTFDTGNLSPGSTSTPVTMNTVGSFPYHCTPHPDMVGTLVVKAAPLPTITISIVSRNGANSYSPNPATVTVGQTVRWTNNDGMAHTATSDDGTTFDTGNLNPGATSAPITMSTAGNFAYHCTPHPDMTGTLVVNP